MGADSGSERRSAGLLAVARFEGERRVHTTVALVVVFTAFGATFLALAPSIVASGAYDDLLEAIPPAMRALFGLETFGSLAGFLSGEYYTFTWILGLGGYLSYSVAGRVAEPLRDGRMDTLLAAPISRTTVLLGTYLGSLVPVVVVNVTVPVVLYVGSVLIDMPISVADLVVLHVLSVPYLLCWAAVGLLVGVVVRRGRTASRAAVGAVVASWLVESVVVSTPLEPLGMLSPTHYFSPPAILVDGTYDFVGAGLLLLATAVVFLVSRVSFRRRDL